jgi:hypothetical protein
LKFVKHDLKWAYPLTMRDGVDGFCWHHTATKHESVATLHKAHLSFGWAGAFYNLYVDKKGRIHILRPLRFVGCGCRGSYGFVGVCVEGAYHEEKEMPDKQLRACQELHDWLDEEYGRQGHDKHCQMPGNATSCPGKYFPWKAILAGVQKDERPEVTARNIRFPRMRNVRAGWCSVGFRPWLRKMEKHYPKRTTIGKDFILVPEPVKKPWFWHEALVYRAEHEIVFPVPPTRKRIPWWRFKK